jgi:geranylgeranyl pyrophosphate synthase
MQPMNTIGDTLPDFAGFAEKVTRRIEHLADGLPASLREPVTALARRPGKGLRPMLVAACASFGAADPARLVRLGAVAELIHLASLLHDDVVDRAAIRRGMPAAHVVAGAEHATLAGLGCFSLAGMEAASLGAGLDRLTAHSTAILAAGQLLDVERAFDTALPLSDYLELTERKTGELFRLCCLLGAGAAEVDAEVAAALATFGTQFGVAFQVLDDCLEFATGSGKPAGTDHKLGLFGAPTLYALARDTAGDLSRLLLSPSFTERDMPLVRGLVIELDGLRPAAALARDRYELALGAISELDEAPRDLLVELAGSIWQDAA